MKFLKLNLNCQPACDELRYRRQKPPAESQT
jgi:hypothetical protein